MPKSEDVISALATLVVLCFASTFAATIPHKGRHLKEEAKSHHKRGLGSNDRLLWGGGDGNWGGGWGGDFYGGGYGGFPGGYGFGGYPFGGFPGGYW